MTRRNPYTDPQEEELQADRIALRIIGVFGIAILLLAACKQDAETIKRLTRDRDELLAALQNVPYLCLENHNLITRILKENEDE